MSIQLPPFPSENITNINTLIAEGLVTKLAGYSTLYTSSLFPGLLLTGLRGWFDVAGVQGCAVISADRKGSFSVNASYPMTCPSAIVSSLGFLLRRSIVSTGYSKDIGTSANVTSYGQAGCTNVFMVANEVMVPSTDQAFARFGVLTGATTGFYCGVGDLPSGDVVAMINGNWTPYVRAIAGSGYGWLATSKRFKLRDLAVLSKTKVLEDMPGKVRGYAEEAYDRWVDEYWAMDRSVDLGTQMRLLGSNGAYGLGPLGRTTQTQASQGLVEPGHQSGNAAIMPDPTEFDRYVTPGSGPINLVYPPLWRRRIIFSDATFSFEGDGLSFDPADTGTVDVETWKKAMFLGREDVQAAVISPSAPNYPAYTDLAPTLEVDLSDLDRSKVEEGFINAEKRLVEQEAAMQTLVGSALAIPHGMTVAVVTTAMRRLDSMIRSSI